MKNISAANYGTDIYASAINVGQYASNVEIENNDITMLNNKPELTIANNTAVVAEKPTKIATVPLGYADGIPRLISNKFYGKLNGKKIKQVGNVAMDQMMFDITGIDAKTGDTITLIDEDLPIENWANAMGTIHYELLCHLKARLARVYTR